ncbi:contractile injection system protein, VgrG/Pvc8 family [Sorangium sp. So ce134]
MERRPRRRPERVPAPPRRASRIFQDKTVDAIVDLVLEEWRIRRRFARVRASPKRASCVRYREADRDFVARLLAEEGLFYHFEHDPGADAETMVIGDDASIYLPILGVPRLVHRSAPAGAGALAPGEDHVHRFAAERSVRPTAAVVRDDDFERPLFHPSSSARTAQLEGGADDGRYEHLTRGLRPPAPGAAAYGLKEPGGAEGNRGVKWQSGQEGGQAGGGDGDGGQARELAVAALRAVAAGEAVGVDMLVRLAEQVAAGSGAAQAGAAPSPALSPRAVLVAQLGEGLGAAAAAGDVEAVRVAHEAIGRLLGAPSQGAAASVQAPVVDLTAERGKRAR